MKDTEIQFPTDQATLSDRSAIVKTQCKGEFWKPCPGTINGYLCCGYQILTPSTGCGMYCKFCILQAYFPYQCQVLYENFNDLEKEVEQKISAKKFDVIRFGTGEFGDSLYSENHTGVACRTVEVLERYKNVILELKTKSNNIGNLKKIRSPQKVIIGFSMNTPEMIRVMEKGTASLEARLEAARECEKMGFFVAFHFDPMFVYDNWEPEYREVVRRILDTIQDYKKIAWVSIGGFRTMPKLKQLLKKNGTHLPLFSGEMITGDDGKLRYFRPLRVAMYKAMDNEFRKCSSEIPLYMCMESPEVWNESGMISRIPNGLVRYLDNRAKEMLKI
ncbi:MAG: radical SAM protein [Fibrobacter sp.]|nr:radical SAM protein [Fibrobacter sp.]